jgi:hypothetical protein
MKATRKSSNGEDLRSIQNEDALLEIARDEISVAEHIACEWIASQERIAIAAVESRERLELARLGVDGNLDDVPTRDALRAALASNLREVLPTVLPEITRVLSECLRSSTEQEVSRAANG